MAATNIRVGRMCIYRFSRCGASSCGIIINTCQELRNDVAIVVDIIHEIYIIELEYLKEGASLKARADEGKRKVEKGA